MLPARSTSMPSKSEFSLCSPHEKAAKKLSSTEEELEELSMKMFHKLPEFLNDDENDQLDEAFQKQHGYIERDTSSDESDMEETTTEVIRKSKATPAQKKEALDYLRSLKRRAVRKPTERDRKLAHNKRNAELRARGEDADTDYEV
jgi:hypothetical protein